MKPLLLLAALLASAPAAGQQLIPLTGTNGQRIYVPTGDADLDNAVKICDSHAFLPLAGNDLFYAPGFVETCHAVMKRYDAIETAKRNAFLSDAAKQQAAKDAADLAWLNKYMGKQ